jgi:acyl carrier protein
VSVTRDQIKEVVLKHLAEAVEGVDIAKVDTSKSMKEIGANSLDMVEIVSASMRELRIKVPRTELSKLTNIDGLLNLLHEVSVEKDA